MTLAPPLLAIPEFSFDSGSVIHFHFRGGGSSRHTSIQMFVRTRAASGTLLAVASSTPTEFIILEVRLLTNHTPPLTATV